MRLIVNPYKTTQGIWAFDHAHGDTVGEALMNGTEAAIDYYYYLATGNQPKVGDQMTFTLDTDPFPEAITALEFISTNDSGTNYKDRLTDMPVWLCPWLQGFFGAVPPVIYTWPNVS